ncbi:MAG: 30S ribosomal protein S12 methylthiotransferase RimO [Bacteroidales bacterium]|nr:30S ribosomal protein S12 methylthiotransferase RimO [Candidatus Cryptobacteroides aphodequi]
MKRIRVITLGCSKNTVDTEHLLTQLGDGFEVVAPEDSSSKVDYLLLNTCGFIGDAKEESIAAILEAAELKACGLVGRLIVFGCLSERYADSLPSEIPEVDAWFGARDLNPIVEYLGCKPDRSLYVRRVPTGCGPATAYLKISEGCDRRCSYCAIPFIRGAHRSVPIETLVEEATLLAARGVKELILIAQDTTFYGLDLYHRRALAELLRALAAVPGIEWMRIHYSYPASFPQDVLDEMASNPKVCKYLDIPLQHIADKVLDNMHRQVDGAWTRELIAKLRAEVPGVVLRTTMIVGHPGEGESEFAELLDFVREARFERLGAFTYSEEEGTWGAAHLADDVPQDEKDKRLDALMKLQGEVSLAFNSSRVGSVERVLVDCVDEDDPRVLHCRSQYESPDVDGLIYVRVPEDAAAGAGAADGSACSSQSPCPDGASGPCPAQSLYTDVATGLCPARTLCPEALVGTFIDVRITDADLYDLSAELI